MGKQKVQNSLEVQSHEYLIHLAQMGSLQPLLELDHCNPSTYEERIQRSNNYWIQAIHIVLLIKLRGKPEFLTDAGPSIKLL